MTERMCAPFDSVSNRIAGSWDARVQSAHTRELATEDLQDVLQTARHKAASCFSHLPPAKRAECPKSAIAGVRLILDELRSKANPTAGIPNPFCDVATQVEQRFLRGLPLHCTLIVSTHSRVTEAYEINYSEIVALCAVSQVAERLSEVYPFGVKVSVLVDDGTVQQEVSVSGSNRLSLQASIRRWCTMVDEVRRIEVCALDSYQGAKLQVVWRDLATELTAGYFEGDSGVVAMLEEFISAHGSLIERKRDCGAAAVGVIDELSESDISNPVVQERVRTGLSYLAHYQAREWLGIMDITLPSTVWQLPQGLGLT